MQLIAQGFAEPGGSVNALPALAPEGVTVLAPGSVEELPHDDFDAQDKCLPDSVSAMVAAVPPPSQTT